VLAMIVMATAAAVADFAKNFMCLSPV